MSAAGMKVRAAVVFAANERWRIVEVELRALREGGALVRMQAAGLCEIYGT
jgi:Zn-dependent alcohol dehydrogenase